LAGRPNLWRIITNVGWLFADRIVRLGVGLVIGVWIARYLGPEQFGLFNYALAFVGLLMPLAMLGLDNVAVREIVQKPSASDETLGTTFALKLVAGIAAYALAMTLILVLKPDAPVLHALVALGGLTLIFQSFDTIDVWFQSQVRSKFPVIARNTSFLLVAVVRVALILVAAPLVAFAAAVAVEGLIAAMGLVIVYRLTSGQMHSWRFSRARASELLSTSWPLLFSGLAIAVYMRIDQIMLGEILDETAVGIYAAAIRISEVWYFIPGAIVGSVAPTIINARKADRALYDRRTQQLLNIMALLGYVVAIPVTVLSRPLVWLLFGSEYLDAAPTLAVHIWAGLFVCLGVAQTMWLLNEGLTRVTLVMTAVGAVINVVLNFPLISQFGPLGAAVATLISYGVTVTVVCFFHEPSRPIARMIVKALALRS
jgi:PST family polysaccharide transporter